MRWQAEFLRCFLRSLQTLPFSSLRDYFERIKNYPPPSMKYARNSKERRAAIQEPVSIESTGNNLSLQFQSKAMRKFCLPALE
jgi:hypothetical protein